MGQAKRIRPSGRKLATLPSGTRADRLGAVIVALQECESNTGRLAMHTLADGSIAIYQTPYYQR